MATVHSSSALDHVAAGRLTAAEVEAGYTIATGRTAKKLVVTDVTLRAIGGAAATADSVDLQDTTSGTKVIVALVAALTQDTVVKPNTANVTATNLNVALGSGEGLKLIAAGGAALDGCTHVDYIVKYVRTNG